MRTGVVLDEAVDDGSIWNVSGTLWGEHAPGAGS